jgi:hypothetical protein
MVRGGLRVRAWLSTLAETCWSAGQGPELHATLRRSGSYSSRHVSGLQCDPASQLSARLFTQLALIGVAAVVTADVYPVSESLILLT